MTSLYNRLYHGDIETIAAALDEIETQDHLRAAVAGIARNLEVAFERIADLTVEHDEDVMPDRFTQDGAANLVRFMADGIAVARDNLAREFWTQAQADAFVNGLELAARKYLVAS
jgi:hypothetical protein